ncbi:jg5573 [Pararge aegeria aegeria]|uniref:Jg5573 protein n=1 Tax=Pararge aegeria aegeria TaxID=348720 RepID=A0A8S4QHS4_9NEOP|nr:jg5573 [Pararge aegeria aegeria]
MRLGDQQSRAMFVPASEQHFCFGLKVVLATVITGTCSPIRVLKIEGHSAVLFTTYSLQALRSVLFIEDDFRHQVLILSVLGKMEAGRAFQILAVRIRNEDAKRFVRLRGI